eukprot:TRINITY_DN1028_c0_g1_i1.p1 TRINITY_DN1028_c0_g1~~TRINITY_DN1028_c0_g1_i1.p1  ORF type:complete len:156 (+),score=21.81 TRINITY_DN1028_c0_g1_i1:281-748(+)
MSRAIQTMLGGFKDKIDQGVPVVIHPLCREAIENACDIGRPAAELLADFAQLDFSQIASTPVWWFVPPALAHTINEKNYQEVFESSRWHEPPESIAERVSAFKAWLLDQPQNRIAVVSHSTFLRDLLGAKEKMENCHVEPMPLQAGEPMPSQQNT